MLFPTNALAETTNSECTEIQQGNQWLQNRILVANSWFFIILKTLIKKTCIIRMLMFSWITTLLPWSSTILKRIERIGPNNWVLEGEDITDLLLNKIR